MAYNKTHWIDNQAPFLDAANLNKIEDGLKSAVDIIPTVHNNTKNIAALATGELYKGIWTPVSGTEYPPSPVKGDSWYIGGLTTPYTFTGGDLNGKLASNQDKILYSGTSWGIIEAAQIPDHVVLRIPTLGDFGTVDQTKYPTVIVEEEERGGIFVYTSSAGADDDGTIFNKWVRQYDGAVNVSWFGTDNTVALKKALEFGGDIFLDKDIDISNCEATLTKSAKLFGDSTIIANASSSQSDKGLLYINPNGFSFSMEGVTLDGDKKVVMGLRIEHDGTSDSSIIIDKCNFYRTYWKTGTYGNNGVFIRGGFNEVIVTNCVIKDHSRKLGNGDPGVQGTSGMTISHYTANYIKNVIVDSCLFDTITNEEVYSSVNNVDVDGLKIFTMDNSFHYRPGVGSVTNCVFENCKGRSIKFQLDKAIVSNCTFNIGLEPIKGGSTTVDFQINQGTISDCNYYLTPFTQSDSTPIDELSFILSSFYQPSQHTRIKTNTVSNIKVSNLSNTGVGISFSNMSAISDTSEVFTNISNVIVTGQLYSLLVIGHKNIITNISNVILDNLFLGLIGSSSGTELTNTIVNLTNITHKGTPKLITYYTVTPTIMLNCIVNNVNVKGFIDSKWSKSIRHSNMLNSDDASTSISGGGIVKVYSKNLSAGGTLTIDTTNDMYYGTYIGFVKSSSAGVAAGFIGSSSGTEIISEGTSQRVKSGGTTDPSAPQVGIWEDAGGLNIKSATATVVTVTLIG